MTAASIASAADDTPSPGRLVVRTCAAEWTRLWTVRSSWWFLLATTVVLVGLGTLLGFESAADPTVLQGEPAWQTAMNIVVLAQFALLAFALTAVTSDYATGGIVPTLQWTPSRTVLFLARALVVVGVATGAGVVLALVAALAADATAGSALVLPWADGPDMVARVAGVIAAGAALAAGLGFLLRSTAGALVSVFLLMLVFPALLPQFGYEWLTTFADALPGAGAVFLLLDEPEGRGMTDASAAVTMSAWAAGALLLGWLRLRRDDVTR